MKNYLLKSMLLLCALVAGSGSVWAGEEVTISSFTFSSHTGWTVEADQDGAKTPSYYLLIASNKYIQSPAIDWSGYKNIKIKVKARKYGGPSNAQLVISVSQGDNTLTTFSPSTTSLAYYGPTAITPGSGAITICCKAASSSKGSGVSEILITGEEVSSDADSEASFSEATPSMDLKTQSSYTQAVSTAAGYDGVITYSMTSNSAGATINATTGEVTPTKAGSVTVKASAAKVEGSWAASSATYTLTVSDTREEADLAWSASSVEIEKGTASYSLPTLTNPHSVDVTYTITGTEDLASESAGVITVDTSIEGTATVKASYTGGTYKPGSVSYTITVYDPTKKGTKITPYSVADVVDLINDDDKYTEDNVWIRGYIIGAANTSTGALLETINVNTNVAIHDDPSGTSDYVLVQLPSGTYRTALNAKDHPYYVGVAEILVKGQIAKYCGKPGLKSPSAGSVVSQKIKVTSVGLATYCTDVELAFDGALEAYIAKDDNGTIKLQQVTNVPANTGVLLRASGISTDTYFDVNVNVTDNAADNVEGNLFVKGNDAAVASGSNPYNYILNVVNDKVGFYRANGQKVAKNRAYLQTTVNASASAPCFIDLNFGGETTGIENAVKSEETKDKSFFNLAGQRVAQPSKGLYIVNGKKVVIK